ncbi:SGNH/GDSL hydrolase family protein [Actinomadura sp. KC345]|uniref:SGNH/GDSL hydrolase family protein n=1 Tax=Actinomadura sp. KC345 TaxID=2530371 RepID=UPI001051C82D|nr:SGNH/GDSL hydrolase family protein [Actinomadura sp. KC345]TDC47853.1 SGNH/GDSL hydrolase family protein [Actinomadura sp. KC345]
MKRPFTFARVPQSMMLIPLAPVLAVQAWRTARRTPRLDPATGDEHGFVAGADPGTGPAYRVVVIGESTAVGVGASQHAQALPGFLAEALRERLRRSVSWSVSGENGATAHRVAIGLLPQANGGRGHGPPRDGAPPGLPAPGDRAASASAGAGPDLVVVTVGINDLIRRRPLRRWTADVAELITALQGEYAHATLVVAGMPPVHRFPAIPQPLRLVLGARARTMDRIMRDAARAGGAVHAPMDEAMARDRGLFASDGFHPSPAGYRAWAEDLARAAAPAGPAEAPGPADPAPGTTESTPPAGTVQPWTVK